MGRLSTIIGMAKTALDENGTGRDAATFFGR